LTFPLAPHRTRSTVRIAATKFKTHTTADLTDPSVKRLVEQIARTKMLCRDCHTVWTEKLAKENRHRRSLEWQEWCPKIFLSTQKHRLPAPTKLDAILNWKYGPKGLLLIGPSGKGKSRCAWKVVEREFYCGKEIEVMDANFGMAFAQKYSVSGAAAYDWLEEKAKADILLMDDTFKVKLTDAAEGAIFNVVNARTEAGLPMIVTTQDNGETLEARMTADRGKALIRRLREFCQVIAFN
jgi:hypothetical protein